MIRACIALLFIGSASPIFCQPSIDSAVYLAFFREAAGHITPRPPGAPPKGEPSTLNGEATDLVPQSIQDAIGITDREAKAVVDAATGLNDEIDALEASASALVFEARLRAANEEKPSDTITERLREFEASRAGIIMRHVERLKASLDAARFRLVEGYIRSRQSDGVFFPAVHLKPRPL